MKKIGIIIFYLLIFILSTFQHPLSANNFPQHTQQRGGFSSYPPQLSQAVAVIYRLPEARELLKKVTSEGPVEVRLHPQYGFQAYWDSIRRIIFVNPSKNRSLGENIISILFELHNAGSDKRLIELTEQARRGEISKKRYVEGIEKMEHENALHACYLLNKGIAQHIFPRDARWHIPRSFEEHYRIQRLYGHSAFIARSYDRMSQQRGYRTHQSVLRR